MYVCIYYICTHTRGACVCLILFFYEYIKYKNNKNNVSRLCVVLYKNMRLVEQRLN